MSENKNATNNRFSREEDISYYTPIYYKLTATETINNGGITCVGCYCTCIYKPKCECLIKLMAYFKHNNNN
jgi:hypothetical protein